MLIPNPSHRNFGNESYRNLHLKYPGITMQRVLTKTRLHDITFCRDGKIRIGARLSKAIDLRPGDCVGIADKAGEYLLYAVKNPPGRQLARCHSSKGQSRNLCANSVELCRIILDKAGVKLWKASFPAGDSVEIDGRIYIPIITRLPM